MANKDPNWGKWDKPKAYKESVVVPTEKHKKIHDYLKSEFGRNPLEVFKDDQEQKVRSYDAFDKIADPLYPLIGTDHNKEDLKKRKHLKSIILKARQNKPDYPGKTLRAQAVDSLSTTASGKLVPYETLDQIDSFFRLPRAVPLPKRKGDGVTSKRSSKKKK
jgi:hypothetical protein